MNDVFGNYGDKEIRDFNAAFENALGCRYNKHLCYLVTLDENENPMVKIMIASWSRAVSISDETAERMAEVAFQASGHRHLVRRVAKDIVEIARGSKSLKY